MNGDPTELADPEPDPTALARRRRRRRRRRRANAVVAIITVAAAVGGGFAGAHPTGTPVVDPLLAAVFAALVTLAASQASRQSRLVLAAVAVGASRGLILVPAVGALGLAFGQVWYRKFARRFGALVGALAAQVLLRWPHLGFTGLTALLAAAASVVVGISALGDLDRNARRLWLGAAGAVVLIGIILAVPAVVGGLQARTSVTNGIAATRGALDTVTNGQASRAAGQLRVATADFRTGAHDVGSWWTAGARLVPVVAQQRQALVEATASARDITASASSDAANLDYAQLRYAGGRIDLAKVAVTAAPLDRLDRELASAQRRLASLTSPWLVSPITDRLHSLGRQLDSAHSSVDVAARVVRVAPGLLGGQGPRHYLVAFVTPAENRGLGGFMGAYGVLTADNGALSLTAAGNSSTLVKVGFNSAKPGSPKITGPPGFLARYGLYLAHSSFGDMTYPPDLPTVDNVLTQVAPQVGLGPIDGTLAIDPAGLAALLRLTGPVTIPGVATPLSPANAESFLLRDQYLGFQATVGSSTRHDYLQDAMGKAFATLAAGSLPGPRQLSADLGPAAHDGDIQFWSNHAGEQPLLRSLHLDGAFPVAGGQDLMAVTTSNAGNSKIDAYLHRSIDDKVIYDPATGAVTDHVTVTLRNDAPATGLPTYVIGNDIGRPAGTASVNLAVYSPLGITDDPAYPTDIRPAAVPELGVNAYDVSLDVAPKASMTVSLTLVGRIARGSHYTLHLRRQASATPDQYSVEVKPAPGYRVSSSSAGRVGPAEVSTVSAVVVPDA